MTNQLTRLTLALAAMNIREGELRSLHAELSRITPSELVRLVFAVRDAAHRAHDFDIDNPAKTITRSSHDFKDASVGQRVDRLLRIEAGLSTTTAFKVMSEALTENGLLSPASIPPLSRKALSVWVDRLVRLVPAKEVLRIATIVRNQIMHAKPSDWSLKNKTQ